MVESLTVCGGQGELAHMFHKSRMTISKLLRPDKIAKTKALASSGVRLGMHLVINAALYNALILFCDFGITVIITIITKE